MKTTTILLAYRRAQHLYLYGSYDYPYHIRKDRQRERFYTALLRRMEEGDRARERLKQQHEAMLKIRKCLEDGYPLTALTIANQALEAWIP